MNSRKHYENRGFGATMRKRRKNMKFRRVSVCFVKARDFRKQNPLFGLRVPSSAFAGLAWNHCFYSGFRPPHWRGLRLVARNHYRNSGFRPHEVTRGNRQKQKGMTRADDNDNVPGLGWNHCFCSGFSHTHWGGFCLVAWNHYKKSGFGPQEVKMTSRSRRRRRRSKSR